MTPKVTRVKLNLELKAARASAGARRKLRQESSFGDKNAQNRARGPHGCHARELHKDQGRCRYAEGESALDKIKPSLGQSRGGNTGRGVEIMCEEARAQRQRSRPCRKPCGPCARMILAGRSGTIFLDPPG